MTRGALISLVLLLATPAARAQPTGKRTAVKPAMAAAETPPRAAIIPEGWKSAGATASYDKKSVWKAINGAAELYLSYGFTRLEIHKLSKGPLEVALQVITLASPLDALGVFLRERPEEAVALKDAGTMAAFAAPAHCLAFRGATYLRVQVAAGTLTRGACELLLAHAARSIASAGGAPDELRLLPTKGRVPGSLGYTREGFLGLRELTRCLHARYGSTGAKANLVRFVALARDEKHAAATLERLRKKNWKQHKQGARLIWHRQVPYKGTVALVKANGGFAGVAGVGTLEAALKLLDQPEPKSPKSPKSPGPPKQPKGK